MVTVEIKDVIGVYMLVAGGIVLGFIFLIFECLYFTRKLAKHPDSVNISLNDTEKNKTVHCV